MHAQHHTSSALVMDKIGSLTLELYNLYTDTITTNTLSPFPTPDLAMMSETFNYDAQIFHISHDKLLPAPNVPQWYSYVTGPHYNDTHTTGTPLCWIWCGNTLESLEKMIYNIHLKTPD